MVKRRKMYGKEPITQKILTLPANNIMICVMSYNTILPMIQFIAYNNVLYYNYTPIEQLTITYRKQQIPRSTTLPLSRFIVPLSSSFCLSLYPSLFLCLFLTTKDKSVKTNKISYERIF